MHVRRFVTGLAVLPVLAAIAAGCGSSSSSGSGGAGSSGSGSGKTVNVGLEGPLTGNLAAFGTAMVKGAQWAIGVINADGGVLGQQVKLHTQDDANDPGDAVNAAGALMSVDHVTGLLGPTAYTSGTVVPLTLRGGIPDLMWGGGAEFDTEKSPNFFRMTPSDTEAADAMALYAHNRGWNRVALAIGNGTGDQPLVPALNDAAKKLGMTVTNSVTIDSGATSYSSEVRTLFSGHPQVVFGQFAPPSAAIVFGEVASQGLISTPWVASSVWFTSDFYHAVGKTIASGPIYITYPATIGGGYKAFLKVLKAKTGQSTPDGGEPEMWDAANLWALGADVAGTFKSPAIYNGIVKAANGPGTACFTYTQCYSLLKAKKSIKYHGAASDTTFNAYHNVFGPFGVAQFTTSGKTKTLAILSSASIQQKLG
jgi:ABC-type branched-subunit amino acid transport system substrate-binding protein